MAKLKKILVVDDEVGIRKLLFDALSSEGFTVTLAKDGQDSLDQMQNRRFDLLITDINMPRLDGIGLLKKMKATGRKEKVIVMTGNTANRSLIVGDMPPVFTLLEKPFQINNFLDVVASAFTRPTKKIRKGAGAG
ncbi:MAG: response regulator [Deltaproteobacteria bacterium]|nr:response regulator [Deltaproteobacteria bacterium]